MWRGRQQHCRFVHSVARLITFLPHNVLQIKLCIWIIFIDEFVKTNIYCHIEILTAMGWRCDCARTLGFMDWYIAADVSKNPSTFFRIKQSEKISCEKEPSALWPTEKPTHRPVKEHTKLRKDATKGNEEWTNKPEIVWRNCESKERTGDRRDKWRGRRMHEPRSQ